MKYEDIELEGFDFTGEKTVYTLDDLKGKTVILYSNPIDDEFMLSEEGENFLYALEDLPADTVVIGAYPEDIEYYKEVLEEHNLDTQLESDNENMFTKAFNNIKEKTEDIAEGIKDKAIDIKDSVVDKVDDIKEKIEDKKEEMETKREEKELEKMDKEEEENELYDFDEMDEIYAADDKPITMRSTFIIGKNGKLLKEMHNVDVKNNFEEIVDYVKTIE